MTDIDFIETLKQKKKSHLADIDRLKGLIESIDSLIKAYSDKPSIVTIIQPSNDINDLNLTEAIIFVMKTDPDPNRGWRGSEITKALEKLGYKSNALAQKVSGRLIERTKAETGQFTREAGPDKITRYRLKPEFNNVVN